MTPLRAERAGRPAHGAEVAVQPVGLVLAVGSVAVVVLAADAVSGTFS